MCRCGNSLFSPFLRQVNFYLHRLLSPLLHPPTPPKKKRTLWDNEWGGRAFFSGVVSSVWCGSSWSQAPTCFIHVGLWFPCVFGSKEVSVCVGAEPACSHDPWQSNEPSVTSIWSNELLFILICTNIEVIAPDLQYGWQVIMFWVQPWNDSSQNENNCKFKWKKKTEILPWIQNQIYTLKKKEKKKNTSREENPNPILNLTLTPIQTLTNRTSDGRRWTIEQIFDLLSLKKEKGGKTHWDNPVFDMILWPFAHQTVGLLVL